MVYHLSQILPTDLTLCEHVRILWGFYNSIIHGRLWIWSFVFLLTSHTSTLWPSVFLKPGGGGSPQENNQGKNMK